MMIIKNDKINDRKNKVNVNQIYFNNFDVGVIFFSKHPEKQSPKTR
jgi:hypothetical protein